MGHITSFSEVNVLSSNMLNNLVIILNHNSFPEWIAMFGNVTFQVNGKGWNSARKASTKGWIKSRLQNSTHSWWKRKNERYTLVSDPAIFDREKFLGINRIWNCIWLFWMFWLSFVITFSNFSWFEWFSLFLMILVNWYKKCMKIDMKIDLENWFRKLIWNLI